MVRKDYGEVAKWSPGHRVEIHPGCDMWMRGARFGTVTSVRGNVCYIKLDKLPRRRLQLTTDRLRPAL